MPSASTAARPDMPDLPARDQAIFALVARLADNKYFLGRRYAEWCSSAPTLESAVATAAMAQDELGHARALYPLLRTLAPTAGAEIEPETRTRFLALPALGASFAGWEDFVAANLLIDGALSTIFAAGEHSSFEPLAGRARKVLQEEQLHAAHASGWVRRLAGEGAAARAALEGALGRVWAEALCWLGPARHDDPLASAGVLDAPPDTLRARLLASIGPVIAETGLALPLRRDAHAKGWRLTTPLPWQRWDAATYLLAPAAVAVAASEE